MINNNNQLLNMIKNFLNKINKYKRIQSGEKNGKKHLIHLF